MGLSLSSTSSSLPMARGPTTNLLTLVAGTDGSPVASCKLGRSPQTRPVRYSLMGNAWRHRPSPAEAQPERALRRLRRSRPASCFSAGKSYGLPLVCSHQSRTGGSGQIRLLEKPILEHAPADFRIVCWLFRLTDRDFEWIVSPSSLDFRGG
jgi:hypothetical protein